MHKKTIVLLCSVMLSCPVMAADHLYPEPSIYAGNQFLRAYDQDIAEVFQAALDRDVILRMIFIPSFIPESAVGIRSKAGRFEIFSMHPSEPVWMYRQRHAGKVTVNPNGKIDGSQIFDLARGDPKQMPVKTCSIDLPQSAKDLLAVVWERVLRDVRYDGAEMSGADGAVFHFAMRKEPRDRRYLPELMAGQVWSGPVGPRMGALIDIATTMDHYCETRDPKTLDALTAKARDFIKAMH